MAGSNAQATKLAIITDLAALAAFTSSINSGVLHVVYTRPSSTDLRRECIFAGRVDVSQDISAGRSGGNTSREEHAAIQLHVRVSHTNMSVADAEARVLVLGASVEGYFAATGPVVTGLLDARVTGYQMVSGQDDDGSMTLLTYTIATQTHLT